MYTDAPPYENQGGGELVDLKRSTIRTIIEETHKLCNDLVGNHDELRVPLQIGTVLCMRVVYSEHPRFKLKTAYISKEYTEHCENMFTMYVAKEQCLNGFDSYLLLRYEGFSLEGPTSEVIVDNLNEFQYPIDWLKEAQNKLFNTDNAD